MIAIDRVSGRTLEIKSAVVSMRRAVGGSTLRCCATAHVFPSARLDWWSQCRSAPILGHRDGRCAFCSVAGRQKHPVLPDVRMRELFFVPWRGVTMVGTDYHRIADRLRGRASTRICRAVIHRRNRTRGASREYFRCRYRTRSLGVAATGCSGCRTAPKDPIVAAGRNETGADGLVVVIGEKLTSAPVLSRTVLLRAIRTDRRPKMPRTTRTALRHAMAVSAISEDLRRRLPSMPVGRFATSHTANSPRRIPIARRVVADLPSAYKLRVRPATPTIPAASHARAGERAIRNNRSSASAIITKAANRPALATSCQRATAGGSSNQSTARPGSTRDAAGGRPAAHPRCDQTRTRS